MKSIHQKVPLIAILLVLFLTANQRIQAQTQKRVIQLSGVVMDSIQPIPGVHIYVPKAGRGTTSNGVGFFSMPVVVGDSVVVSSIGYARQHYIVPDQTAEFLTVVFELQEDTIMLGPVTVMAFPTEEVFKEAILALNLPEDQMIDRRNLNAELLALMLKTTPMDGYQNQRYYLNEWINHQNDKFMPITNPFLNPFNWVKFFNGLKDQKKKKKK